MHTRPRGGFSRRPWLAFLSGEGVFLGIAALPDARRHLTAYLLLFLAGSLLSLFAARSLSASPRRLVLVFAAAFRVTLLFRPPDLSEDVFRYVWDGRVSASGTSPYAAAPAAAPAGFFPELRRRLAYPDYRTIYPPAAQAAFRIAALVPGDGAVVATKALFAAADVGVVALLFAAGGPSAGFGAALYAFHPLPVTEVAGQGHVDSLGLALLLASLVYLLRRRSGAAGVAFAAAALVKYVPVAAAPALLRRGGARFAVAALAVGSAMWVAAARGGVSPAAGLAPYATRWEFNSVLYPATAAAMDAGNVPERAKTAYMRWKADRVQRPWMQKVFPYFYTAFFARVLLAAALALVLVAIGVFVRDVETATFASLAALLLASPTLHPWYLLWILPFAARRREPAFLYLCTAAPLAYGMLHPLPGWSRPAILAVEYVPFVMLLGWTWWRGEQGASGALVPTLSRDERE